MFWNMKLRRFWNPGRNWWRGPVKRSTRSETNFEDQVGIVVDAGPQLGYGHAMRCLRLARKLIRRHPVAFYPLSESCREFIEASGFATAEGSAFPKVVITDLREAHGITAS